jgi:hypothetical protein
MEQQSLRTVRIPLSAEDIERNREYAQTYGTGAANYISMRRDSYLDAVLPKPMELLLALLATYADELNIARLVELVEKYDKRVVRLAAERNSKKRMRIRETQPRKRLRLLEEEQERL